MDHETEQAIARDLTLCDIGMALTKGRLRRRYAAQRAACIAAIREANRAEGLDQLTAAEILAELTA